MTAAKVLIVDDHVIFAQSIRLLLETWGYKVVADVSSGESALAAVAEHQPDLVLLDLRLPGLDGIETCRLLKERHEHTKVIILTMFDSEQFVIDAVKAGADGFLLKEGSKEDLQAAISMVLAGKAHFEGHLTRRALLRLSRSGTESIDRGFSDRERQVLCLMAAGRTNREIALNLHLSERTVKGHVEAVMRKLDAKDRTHAVATALRNGLVV